MTDSTEGPTPERSDADKLATRANCPDGRLRCLDCETPADELCMGRQMGCGYHDGPRVRVVELESQLAAERARADAEAARHEITCEVLREAEHDYDLLQLEARKDGPDGFDPLACIQAIRQRSEAAERALAEAQRDAGRYRCLRNANVLDHHLDYYENEKGLDESEPGTEEYYKRTDAAVDYFKERDAAERDFQRNAHNMAQKAIREQGEELGNALKAAERALEEARSQLLDAQRDGERYRWLRMQGGKHGRISTVQWEPGNKDRDGIALRTDDLDAFVDAALAARRQG